MTAPLRERDGALALLASAAERARAGTGGLVLLRGATGTGRTAVLERAARHAEGLGLRVLHARCSPEYSSVPFGTLLHLLDAPEDAGPNPDGTRGAAERLWRLLLSYAAENPLLLAVDDAHLLDDHSRRWLAEAARRVDRLPVLVVATERSQYDIDTRPPGLAHALSPSLVHAHTLAPLTDPAAAAIVRAAFPSAGPRWTAECVRAGAGSPLLLHALLDDLGGTAWHDGPAPDGAPPLPETCAALYPGTYPAAVSWWLNSAGTATADVARCLAALEQAWPGADTGTALPPEAAGGDPVDLLAAASGADPARVTGWLAAMTRLGLLRPDNVGRPRYAHPLLRDAVLTGWPTPRREAAHRAAAEVLLHRGGRVEAVARHLLHAPPVGEAWALRVLRDAVTVAVDGCRVDDAVRYLRRALAEPLTDDLRQRLLTTLGSLEYATDDAPSAVARLAEAQDLAAEPRDRVRTAVALGTALAGLDEMRTAMEVLRRTELRLADHPGLAHVVRAAYVLLSDHDLTTRQEVYRWLRERDKDSPALVDTAAQALLLRYSATAGLMSADEAMTRVRRLLTEPTDPLSEPFLLSTAAAVAEWADELDEADRLVERGLAGQHPALLHPVRSALLNTRADISAARGDHAGLLTEYYSRGDHTGTGPGRHHVGTPGPVARTRPSIRDGHVLMALVHTGRLGEAQRFADGFDLGRAPDSWALNRFLYARGVLRSAAGDQAGALHDFLECGRRQSARDMVSPVVTPWRTAVAECRLALGHHQEALDLAAEELRLAKVWDTPRTVGRSLRVLATATGGRRGLELAEEAVRILREAPVDTDTELIPALLAQGRQLLASGERSQARDLLREAAERAERTGSLRLRDLAGQALREGGARRSGSALTGSDALTASERRIAELAAAGRTNSEIAALLHLARRTVETHLTSTYRKLRIRRRAELPTALLQNPQEPPTAYTAARD